MNWLIQKWYSRPHFISYLLAPFSAIYRLIIFIRYHLYQLGIKKITHFPVSIIVVGNITVGGTGKTPFVIWLAQLLKDNNYRPGIVSRGYRGIAKQYPQWVRPDSDPGEMGDEAVLIAKKTHCPMVVDPDRVNAVKILLNGSNCDIIISDDGLQHYGLGRDIEICLIDGERRFGNGFCLPAGPLREPLTRLNRIDFKVVNGLANANEFSMQLVPDKISNLSQCHLTLTPERIQSKPIHAVTGIGNPQRFFQSLRRLGFTIIEHIFPDHYLFQPQDFIFAKEDDMIVITEKDAVKCLSFVDQRFWCLPVIAQVDQKFATILLKRLKSR